MDNIVEEEKAVVAVEETTCFVFETTDWSYLAVEVAAKKNTEIAGSVAEKYFCRIAVASVELVVEKTTAAGLEAEDSDGCSDEVDLCHTVLRKKKSLENAERLFLLDKIVLF